MPRYIDADAMDVEKIYCYYSDHCRSEDVQEWVDEQPTLDLEPVLHGRWMGTHDGWYYSYSCSECGMEALTKEESMHDQVCSNFCPNCGARMDLEREAEGRADKR